VYDDHIAMGGKMVDFNGFDLPVQYPSGVKKECENTRSSATLFDVSHMGQVRVHGPDCVKFVDSLVVGDVVALESVRLRFGSFAVQCMRRVHVRVQVGASLRFVVINHRVVQCGCDGIIFFLPFHPAIPYTRIASVHARSPKWDRC